MIDAKRVIWNSYNVIKKIMNLDIHKHVGQAVLTNCDTNVKTLFIEKTVSMSIHRGISMIQ